MAGKWSYIYIYIYIHIYIYRYIDIHVFISGTPVLVHLGPRISYLCTRP